MENLRRDSFVERNVFIKLKSTKGYATGKSYVLGFVAQPSGMHEYVSVQGAKLSAPTYETRCRIYSKDLLTIEEFNKYDQQAEAEYLAAIKRAEALVKSKER